MTGVACTSRDRTLTDPSVFERAAAPRHAKTLSASRVPPARPDRRRAAFLSRDNLARLPAGRGLDLGLDADWTRTGRGLDSDSGVDV